MSQRSASEKQERLTRLVAAVSLAFSLVYIIWRWGWTLNTEALWFSVPLAVAETYGLLTAFFLTFTGWRLTHRESPAPLPDRTVDVFITTYDESIAIIRKTAVAARELRYPHETWILDDGRREEVRRLAAEIGVRYLRRENNEHAKAGNLNNALAHTSGEFILQLDADHVPLPNMIDALIGFFADERLAFVQSPQDFYNTDAFTYDVDHRTRRIWEDQQLFFRVLQPGKDRVNAAFFVGSCAMIRRAALEDIGGIATRTITEDIETSLLLHARGWRSAFYPRTLAYGLAPSTAAAFHVQHLRWGQGAMQALRHYHPLRMRGLSFAQRIAYFDSLTTYLGGFQRLILYLAPIIYFTTGVFPVHASATQFALMFVPYITLQFVSFKLLARGHGSLVRADRYAMAKFFTHELSIAGYFTKKRLKFRVTPKLRTRVSVRTYAPHAALIAATVLALGWGIWERHLGYSDEIAGWGELAPWANALFALWNAWVAVQIIRMSVGEPQKRTEHRHADAMPVDVRVMRQDGKLSSVDVAIAENLSPVGAALRCMNPIPDGARVELMLRLEQRAVEVRGHTVYRRSQETRFGTVHVHGVAFEELDAAERDVIELHCAQHLTPLERQRFQEVAGLGGGSPRRYRNLRRQQRLAVGLPVRVTAGTNGSSRSLGTGMLENVSDDGARLLIDQPVAPDSLLRIRVPGSPFDTAGRVVFVHELETSVGMRFVAGLHLLAHDAVAAARVSTPTHTLDLARLISEAAAPAPEAVPAAIAAPVTEPIAQPIAEPIAEPVGEPTVEAIAEPAAAFEADEEVVLEAAAADVDDEEGVAAVDAPTYVPFRSLAEEVEPIIDVSFAVQSVRIIDERAAALAASGPQYDFEVPLIVVPDVALSRVDDTPDGSMDESIDETVDEVGDEISNDVATEPPAIDTDLRALYLSVAPIPSELSAQRLVRGPSSSDALAFDYMRLEPPRIPPSGVEIMPNKNAPAVTAQNQTAPAPLTIRSTSARFDGNLSVADSIEIQCEVTGELTVGGTLIIGSQGNVRSRVNTTDAIIYGFYDGTLKASGTVQIASGARVSGTIEASDLVIAKGALFTGSVSTPQATANEESLIQQAAQAAQAQATESVVQRAIAVEPSVAAVAGLTQTAPIIAQPAADALNAADAARLQFIALS